LAEAGKLSKRGQFGWGVLGALAPYVVRAASTVQLDTPLPLFGLGYLAATSALLAVGGAWSVALESERPWFAMYHGANVPLVFSFLFHAFQPPPH
jgi:hypothetical protein